MGEIHNTKSTSTLQAKNLDRIIREKERQHLTGVPTVSWWRYEKLGEAPKGFKIGSSAKGWLLSDIQSWISSKVGEKK